MRKLLAVLLICGVFLGITACGGREPLGRYEYTEKNGVLSITPTVDIVENSETLPSENKLLTKIEDRDKTYQNPILDTTSGENEGFGDPYVLRHNGKYYLYYTASKLNCWESEDLVNWTYVGVCTNNEFFRGSWAPEVKYYNGSFYMTTTGPGGDGNYILKSDSPTGPFEAITEDIDTNLDATLFIDDNGDWYMYYPKKEDINVVKMSSVDAVDYWTFKNLGVTVAEDAWTEGPVMIKYKDTYFLTFCGGEFMNTGYQIHYATSDGDLMDFTRGENSPILINTDITTYPGLGHSCMVTGPNLDSLYKIYHSMPYQNQPRVVMIDPLYINGNYMQALGPTFTAQQVPDMPDIYSRFDSEESLEGWTVLNAEIIDAELKLHEGGIVLSETGIEGDFTAEYNFLSIEDVYANDEAFLPAYGKVGAIFDYKDLNNYGAAYINTNGSILEIVFTVEGKEVCYKEYLKASFEDNVDYSVLQKLAIMKDGNIYRFLFNDKTVCEYECDLTGGAIGVSCVSGESTIGFVGAEGNVWHSSYKGLYKPVEGEFGALLCVETGLKTVEYNKREYLSINSGESYNYLINAEAARNYDFGIKYRSTEDFAFELYHNGNLIYQGFAPASISDRTEVFRNIDLLEGYGVITFKITEGSADIFNYKFITSTYVTESVDFDLAAPIYAEGEWYVDNNKFTTDKPAKYLYGDREWANYSVSAVFESKANTLDAHMIFRVTNESLSPKHSLNECRKYYLGYYVRLFNDGENSYVGLYKQNYSDTELSRLDVELPFNTPIEVSADVVDENIKVYLNGELVIEYSDPNPWMKGAVGFANIMSAAVSDIQIKPIS